MFKWRRFFNLLKKSGAIISIITLVFVMSQFSAGRDAQAAGIDIVTTTLVTSEAINTESQITIVFSPTTAITTGDTITVYIGENSGGDPWVDTDGTIDSTDITCAQVGATFGSYVQTDATATAGLSASCDVASGGDTSSLTMTIGTSGTDSLYNPAGADIYTVSVVTNDDAGAGVVYVGNANDVNVSVTVLPNLSMLLDNADGTYCTGTPVVTCNLGVVLTTTVASGNYDINVGTNASGGATISIAESGDLGSITDFVEDSGAITAGTDEYGISVATSGTWTFGTIYLDNDSPIEASIALASSGAAIAESGNDITVTHKVAVDSSVAAGSHSHTVTYTAAADF
ncbi:MAG: hypothetical protein ACNFW9_04785 [Candidatus Kerfeldbacteria bacterium]